MAALILKPGRDRSVRLRHPWVFSGAIDRVDGDPAPGATVEVRAADGTLLGRAAWSPRSMIRGRLWTIGGGETVGVELFRQRLRRAVDWRRRAGLLEPGAACRLLNGEADGFPGLIVDRYDRWLVAQFLAMGVEVHKEVLARLLMEEVPGVSGLYERSDVEVRRKEGLPLQAGPLLGEEPPGLVVIRERGLDCLVDIRHGHKTGYYLDQRDNRAWLAPYAAGGRLLNLFSYTGGFALAALQAGAGETINVDSSAPALDLLREQGRRNGLDPARLVTVQADVFSHLRQLRDAGERFDMVVLDPPKFAETQAQVDKAARGYKDINLLALKLLQPGGLLLTFSCSGAIGDDLFWKILFGAAVEAGREVQVLARLSAGVDHPLALAFPEGLYLKGLACRLGH
ncbi:MAG: class I SAM-dependent methyltransferase [Magnetococcales bacterium]|nr:class I SAM-dependent methyltransferase [Magnetococcales bacterium]